MSPVLGEANLSDDAVLREVPHHHHGTHVAHPLHQVLYAEVVQPSLPENEELKKEERKKKRNCVGKSDNEHRKGRKLKKKIR